MIHLKLKTLLLSIFFLETETFVQAKLKPLHKQMVHGPEVTVQKLPMTEEKEAAPVQQAKAPVEKVKDKENEKKSATTQGLSPAVITTLLLLLPLVLVITIGVFIRWKKSRMYGGNYFTERIFNHSFKRQQGILDLCVIMLFCLLVTLLFAFN